MLYEFKCECGEMFEELMSLKEYESHSAKCPKCSSANVKRTISNIPVKFNTKWPTKSYLK